MLDTLRDFRPENELPETGTHADAHPEATPLTNLHGALLDRAGVLAALRERDDPREPLSHSEQSMTIAALFAGPVAIEWYEAVAISQAICETLRLSGDGSGPVRIGPEHVSIDGSGAVHVAAQRKQDGRSALDEVADLLRAMLADRDVPTPLRLALSQTATNNSVEEWANTIAYYERPNRAALIRGLYERAKNGSSQPPVAVIPVASAPAPLVPTPNPPKAKTPNSSLVQHLKRYAPVIGLAVVASAIIAVTVWAIQTRRPENRTVSDVAVPAAENAPAALSSATAALETLVNRIPVIGRRETEPEQVPPPPPSGRWIHLPSPFDSQPRVYQTMVLPITRSLPQSIPFVELAAARNTSPGSSISSVPNTIYSAADNDVMPPVAIYPQFPSIPAGTEAKDVAEFDVIVTESGEVESVRARQSPASLGDALKMTMSLSAAKTWRFRPGVRNGEPVKYRTVISILKSR